MKYILALISVIIIASCSTDDTPKTDDKEVDSEIRVVTLGATMTELVYALGKEEVLVGVDMSSIYPEEAKDLPQVPVWQLVTPESVLGLNPTDVLAMPDAGPKSTLDRIKNAGINLFQPTDDYSIEWTENLIIDLGQKLGQDNRYQDILDEMDVDKNTHQLLRDSIGDYIAQSGELNSMFIYIKGGKVFRMGGKGTTADAMFKETGINNINSALEGWANVGPEYSTTVNPDFVVVSEAGIKSIGGIESLKNTPGLGDMLAIKEGRVLITDELAFLGYGPRVIKEQIKLMEFAMSQKVD